MTESEAIKELYTIRLEDNIILHKKTEALNMAIKALEEQIEMRKCCQVSSCDDCPYCNPSLEDNNRCMNDFII